MNNVERLVNLPFCRSILGRFIDMTDDIAVEERRRDVAFRLNDKVAKQLYLPSEPGEDNEAWLALCELSKKGWFRIELGKVGHGDPEFLSKPRPRLVLNADFEQLIRVHLGREERADARIVAWRQHVDEASSRFSGGSAKLRATPLVVPGLSDHAIINRLIQISDYLGERLYLRELSARLFGGASKILDGKGHIVAELFGHAEPVFMERPISLAVHLPKDWSGGIVFVENETTFVSLVDGRLDSSNSALVYSGGFKASASRIRSDGQAFLTYTRSGFNDDVANRFEDWLLRGVGSCRSFFWGDLDFSGAQILGALRSTFQGTEAWKPGYAPMLDALKSGVGHFPEMVDKELQVDPGLTGCEYMDRELLPAMREMGMFVDQEYV